MLLNASNVIKRGAEIAIKRRCLKPLLRAIKIALAVSQPSKTHFSTIFSCDSFCSPHLEAQLNFYKHIAGSSPGNLSFFNFPISHYITSAPDKGLLELANEPIKLLELNKQLQSQQNSYHCLIPADSQLPSYSDDLLAFSCTYQNLVQSVEDKAWEEIFINNFPFHELAHRDLSLTYKCIPSLTSNNKQPFYRHFIQANKFNLWLLCLLVCESGIGSTCFGMSAYTATNIFLFYCNQTGRKFRIFGPPSLDLAAFGLSSGEYMCVASSPNAATELTTPGSVYALSQVSISPKINTEIQTAVDMRFTGQGSHTYSRGQEQDREEDTDFGKWISTQKELNKQIISLFTSSPDELIGQQYAYKHFASDLSHLAPTIFCNQEDWIEQVVRHFSQIANQAALIIRLHPRLAADKRGLPESPYLQAFMLSIREKIGSCLSIRLVDAADPVSSYWVGMQSNLILNGWSTIGLEFAIKGKIVTNAFYKTAMGGAAIYPVHINTIPLRSPSDYFERVSRLMTAIKQGIAPNINDYISTEEASKAFLCAFTSGLVNMADKSQLYSQIASPQVLTPQLLSLMHTP